VSNQPPLPRNTFRKAEHLCSRNLITTVFEKGRFFYYPPFKVIWLDTNFSTSVPAQLLPAVPKRFLRKAWQRNLMKRYIREAYRQHKAPFYSILETKEKQCALAIVFTGKKIISSQETDAAIILILRRLTDEYEKVAI
jgi:ribonuclease P protein component